MNNGRRTTWQEWLYRGTLLTLILTGLGFVFESSNRQASDQQRLESHLMRHPDSLLTSRIDRQQVEIDMLRARIRALEIRLGNYETSE